MLIGDRDAVLEQIQQDKSRIALRLEQVRAIDSSLEKHWGIVFPNRDAYSWRDLLAPGAEATAVKRFQSAHDDLHAVLRQGKSASARSSAALYDALAHPAVLGPVTSQRRHFIIDGITIAIGLAKELRLERIIDVGCHTGITTNLISLELQRRVLGIDPSVAAINYARSQVRSAAEFAVASIPFEGREQFDLAVVIDSLSEDAADVEGFLRGLGSILVPDGIAIVVSQYWVSARPAHVRQQLRAAGFDVGYADVVGGLGSIPLEFATEGVVVLVKAGGRRYPENWRAWMESEWHRFREYANSASTPLREKTQAFERACRKHLINKGIDGRVGVSES